MCTTTQQQADADQHACEHHGSSAMPHAAPAGAPRACGCGGGAQGMQVGEAVRWVDAKSEMEFPAVPFPSKRVFAVAGEAKLRALVARHHERLLATPIAGLYPSDPERFAHAVTKAADYAVEATGGPAAFTPVNGNTCMRTRHFPFTIDEAAREIWLGQLWLSFDEVGFPAEVREEYWNWQEAMSIRMINRRTTKAAPRRVSYAEAVGVFGAPAAAPAAKTGCGCGCGHH